MIKTKNLYYKCHINTQFKSNYIYTHTNNSEREREREREREIYRRRACAV